MRRWRLCLCLLLLLVASIASAATVTKILSGSVTTLLSTELTSLASNTTSAASGVFDNTQGGTYDGYAMCFVEGNFTFSANPAAGSVVQLWFAESIDASAYDDCGVGAPEVTLPLRSTAATTHITVEGRCPALRYQACAKNDNTGVSITSGTIRVLYQTPGGF